MTADMGMTEKKPLSPSYRLIPDKTDRLGAYG
jgi:hypothetical protein